MKINFVQRFFIWCSGRDVSMIKKSQSKRERFLATMLGATLLIPAFMIFFSVTHLAWEVSGNKVVSIGAGAFFFYSIFLLDRGLINTKSNRLTLSLFARIMLAVTLSFAVSFIIEIEVFKDVITQQQLKEITAEKESVQNKYRKQIAKLKTELIFQENDLEMKRSDYITELDGTGGTRKKGLGLISIEKNKIYQNEKQRFESQASKTNKEIAILSNKLASEEKRIKDTYAKGILGSLRALWNIEDPIVVWGAWVFRFIFILIDLSPLLLKIGINQDSQYNEFLQQEEQNLTLVFETSCLQEKEKLILKEKLNSEIEQMDLHSRYLEKRIERIFKQGEKEAESLNRLWNHHLKVKNKINKIFTDPQSKEKAHEHNQASYVRNIEAMLSLFERIHKFRSRTFEQSN